MNILNTYNEFDLNNFDLNLDHYGAESCEKNYSFGPTVRDDYVLHFIVEGKGTFTVNKETIPLKEGDIFMLPKDVMTFYQADAKEPWSYLWVGFSGLRAEDILKESDILDRYFCHSKLDSPILAQMKTITEFSDNPLTSTNELILTGELYKLLALFIKEFPKPNTNDGQNLTKAYIKQAKKIIQTQYDTPLKVSDIAKRLNLSRSYLYKIFKETTGYSLKDYILQVKMERSAILLENLQLNISEVSNSVGFTDPLAFSKSFKNYFNISPKHFRQRSLNKMSS